MKRWTGEIAAAVVLVAITASVFAPVWHFPFVNYDDPAYVRDNPAVLAGLTMESVAWAFTTGHASNWHPLTWLSHMLDVELFGPGPEPQHRTNLILHLISVVVLLLLIRRWTGRRLPAFLVAAVFAWHPTHVESVAWVSERKDVLSALLLWLTLWAYTTYARRPTIPRYLAVAGLFALALMAKPMVVTAPCLMLLLDLWPLGRWDWGSGWRKARSLVLEKLPLFALVAASAVVTVVVQRAGGAVSGLEEVPLLGRLLHAVVACGAYVKMFVWPVGLSVLYPHPGWPSIPGLAVSLLLLLGFTGMAWIAWRGRRGEPGILVGWLWFLGTLVPVIGLVQVGAQGWADRYTYIPYVGLSLALVLVLEPALHKRAVQVLAVTAVLALLPLTHAQVLRWQSSETLFRHGLAVTQDNHMLHHTLAITLMDGGDPAAAEPHFREAVRIRPRFAPAQNGLGIAAFRRGGVEEAASAFRAALAVQPDNPRFRNNLGNALEAQGRMEEALAEYRKAIQRAPDDATGPKNLGLTLARMGRLAEAEAALLEAARLDPQDASTLGDLGNVLARQGRVGEALERYREALRRDPNLELVRGNLITLLTALGREDEAARMGRDEKGEVP